MCEEDVDFDFEAPGLQEKVVQYDAIVDDGSVYSQSHASDGS